jgi:exonuclease SbcC
MRPIKLTIKHFGPFAGTEVIDFEKFQSEGLFLINGQTGSGKTSILDAMTFAIYGEVLGLRGNPINQKGVAVRLKSDYSDPNATPEVILEVDINGTRHRFTRSPKFRKPGNSTDTQPKAALEVLEGSEWVALSPSAAEVGDLAVQRLGLSKDQFAQLILLPQGGFAAFLNAKNDKKAEILGELFPATTYDSIRLWIKEQRDQAQVKIAKLNDTKAELEARLRQATGNEELNISDEEIGETVRALDAAHADNQKLLDSNNKTLAPLLAKLNNAEASKLAADAIAKANLDIEKANDEIKVLEGELKQLGITKPTEAVLAEELAKANQDTITISKDLEKFNELSSTEELLTEQSEALTQLQANHVEAVADLEAHESVAETLKEAIKAGSKLYVELVKCEQQVKDLKSHKKLLDELIKLDADLKKMHKTKATAEKAHEKALTKSISIMEIYHQDLAANLADKLQPNKACLVCGSKDHPKPATPKDGAPSRADLDTAISEVDGAKENLDSAILAVKTQLAMIGTSSKQLPNDSSIEAVGEKLEEALSDLEEVNSKLLMHSEQKAEFDKANEAVKATKALIASGAKDLEVARSAVDATKGSIKVLTKALDGKSQSELEKQLSKIQTKADALGRLAPQFAALKSNIVNAQAIVAANKEASLNVIDDLEGLRLEVSQMQEALNEIRDQQTRVSDQHKSVTKIQESFSALLAKNEKAQQAEEQWANLESYTSGNAGRKIDLATFYLGYRLKQVLGAANHRLYAMTDGRYALVHDESVSAAHGAKGGLAIMVHDSNSGQRRGPESLSGGETFMASLSLALGLSDIVSAEAGGRRLEAFFVDEGFGSLDTETLDQVMDSLDELRATGRMVGLVSHVESMRSRVPAQIVVNKTNSGSTIQLVGV